MGYSLLSPFSLPWQKVIWLNFAIGLWQFEKLKPRPQVIRSPILSENCVFYIYFLVKSWGKNVKLINSAFTEHVLTKSTFTVNLHRWRIKERRFEKNLRNKELAFKHLIVTSLFQSILNNGEKAAQGERVLIVGFKKVKPIFGFTFLKLLLRMPTTPLDIYQLL